MSRHDAWLHGEIGDDGRHPNSPNHIDPTYGEDDAQCDVAADLIAADEVAALVSDVHESIALLDWIAHNVEMPQCYLRAFRQLDQRARGIGQAVDAKVDSMGRAA